MYLFLIRLSLNEHLGAAISIKKNKNINILPGVDTSEGEPTRCRAADGKMAKTCI